MTADAVDHGLADVVLIAGPGGAGKTTLSRCLGVRLDRVVIGEDDVWVEHGWGHGTRTPEQEQVVQRDVLDTLATAGTAVLELILYKPAPNPLTAYEEGLAARGVTTASVLLRVDPDEAVRRMIGRGRPNDLSALDRRRAEVEHQLRMLELAAPGRVVVDVTGRDAESVCAEVMRRLAG